MDCIEPLLVTEDKIQLRKKSFECQLEKATMQKPGPAQCDEQKDAVNDQEAAAGPAGPSNPGVLASESSSVSVPQAVLSVNPLDPLRNNVRRKMYEIVLTSSALELRLSQFVCLHSDWEFTTWES